MKKFLLVLGLMMGVMVSGFSKKVFAEVPEFYIKSINPGYTVDGKNNVGEVIEIGRKNSDAPVSLAGLHLSYTNSSGNTVVLADFSKYTWTAGETTSLQLASSPGSELAKVRYTKTLAFKAGPLKLIRDEEVLDEVCWTGKEGCYMGFDSSNPTTLVRNLETGEFEYVGFYTPDFGGELIETDEGNDENVELPSVCKGVTFSEVLSYYDGSQSEQFVELYNNNSESVSLEGCFIKYKNKMYSLGGVIGPEGYFMRLANDFRLTKNPTNKNTLELIDANGVVLDVLEYPNGQRKGASYAFIGFNELGSEIWKVTYAPTPGEANNYQEFRTCEEGKVINEETGNCVKVTSVAEKICGPGQYLNILTGRCKKNSEDGGVKECKEGYYLNEETGRCKKIYENDGADFALVPETYTEESSFVALYLILGVLGVGLIYIVYEFRHEILKLAKKLKR